MTGSSLSRGLPLAASVGRVGLIVLALVATAVAHQQPDRSTPPAPGPAPVLELPPIHKQTLSNGLAVWIVEMHDVPVVAVDLIVKSGASADPPGRFGVASFTAAMLDEGAGARDALELADAIEFLGVSIDTSAGFDASTVRLYGPTSKLDEALPIMADIALRPAFPASELERLRKERLTSLLQLRDNASLLATTAFARILYGPRHRYGAPILGSEAANAGISVGDLRAFYTAHYQPQNAHLIVVGDVRPAEATARLEPAFGAWANGALPPAATLPPVEQHDDRRIYLLDRPGSAQSQIRIGWIGVPRTTEDYFVLEVLNTVLGGSFTSRLNQNLREEHGYSYGAGSSFDMRVSAGPFFAAAGVQTDKTIESLREFFNELTAIREPIPADELARTKNYLALGFPAAFETTGGVARELAELVTYGLPETLFESYVPRIQAVTAADVQRAAQQYIQPDKFAVVVVGDLSMIEAPIRAANVAPVEVLAIDEVLR